MIGGPSGVLKQNSVNLLFFDRFELPLFSLSPPFVSHFSPFTPLFPFATYESQNEDQGTLLFSPDQQVDFYRPTEGPTAISNASTVLNRIC